MTDTIFALATAPGRAAVAVMRLSGPGTRSAIEALAGRAPAPRRASLRTLKDLDGAALDQALLLWFPGPGSYTGEDVAELHLHGGPGVVDGVTAALLALGLRLAEPGEFTRRAFANGRLSLDQAEAVADLVDAEAAAQARQALGQLEGALGARYEHWRERLTEAMARLEAAVDFPDEDVPPDVADQARAGLRMVATDLDLALADEARGQRVREGYAVAVIGAPNSGKSSLVNRLTGRDTAIVTSIPGTTRDVIDTALAIDGYRVILSDMAGVRTTDDPVESEGVRRARARASSADLRLWVVDQSAGAGAWCEAAELIGAGDILLLNKSDLPSGLDAQSAGAAAASRGIPVMCLSLVTGDAESVRGWLAERVRHDLAGSEFPVATRARHSELLRAAREHLGRALVGLDQPELAAEDARLAARALAQVTGRIDAEDILARVFATFCIGK